MSAVISNNKVSSLIMAFFLALLLSSCAVTNTSIYKLNSQEGRKQEHRLLKKSTAAENKTLRLPFTQAVYSILVDSKQRLWIGSREEGVCQIHVDVMQCFTSVDGLVDNQVRSIQEDERGHIWFASGAGLTRYDGKRFIAYKASQALINQGEEQIKWNQLPDMPGLLGDNGMRVHQYQKQESGYFSVNGTEFGAAHIEKGLWFNAGNSSGAIQYDGDHLSYFPFPLPSNNLAGHFYPTTWVHKGKKKLWFASYSGFFGFDGQSMIAINNKSFGFDLIDRQLHIRSIFEDSKGNLWIGNNGLGVGVLAHDGSSVLSLTEKNGLTSHVNIADLPMVPESDGIARVFAINEDSDGNMWFGTRDAGAWRYDGEALTQFKAEAGLSSNYIRVIYRDRQDQMWFAAGDGSVYQFNGVSFDRIY